MITLTEEQAQQIEETLVLLCKTHPEVNGGFIVNMALNNIREARAQEQADQEPVATVVARGFDDGTRAGNTLDWIGRNCENDFPIGTKLYAAPVRTKDLTDDEIDEIPFNRVSDDPLLEYARAVIAKFKEKNK